MADTTGILKTQSQLQQEQTEAATRAKQLQAEQQRLAELSGKYLPKVGLPNAVDPNTGKMISVNKAYEQQYREQFARTQGAYRDYASSAGLYNANVDAYNAQVQQYKQQIQARDADAQAQVVKLNLTPKSESDIAFAKQLADKGYISQDDYSAYKNIATQNIANQNTANLAKEAIAKLNTTPTAQADITYAQSLFNKGYISKTDYDSYVGIANSNMNLMKPGQQYELVTGNIQVRVNPNQPLTGDWRKDYTWVDAGWRIKGATDRSQTFQNVEGLPNASELARSVKGQTVTLDTNPYLQNQQLQEVAKRQSDINARDTLFASLEAQAKVASAQRMANFGGSFSADMAKLAKAPVGTITDVGKALNAGVITPEYAKELQQAQLKSNWQGKFTDASLKLVEMKQGEDVSQLINLTKMNFAPQVGEPGYHSTPSNPMGIYHKPIPLFDPVTGKPNIRLTDDSKVAPEFKKDEKYGLMIREDIKSQEPPKELQSNIDATHYVLYPLAKKAQDLTKYASEKIDRVVDLNEKYNPVVKELNKTSTGKVITSNVEEFGQGALKGVASLPEFVVVAGLGGETVVRNTINNPVETAKVTGAGLIQTVGGLEQGLSEHPAETLGMLWSTKKVGDLTDIGIGKASETLKGLTDIKTKSTPVSTERPVTEEIQGLKTKEERVQEIKTHQFEQSFKPETPLGRTTEVQGISGLNPLETKAEALARIRAEEIKAAIKPEEAILGKSTELPSNSVPESLKGLGTKDDRIAYLDEKLAEKTKPATVTYHPEAPATNVSESLRSLFGDVLKQSSIEARTLREIPSGGVVPESLKGLATKEERLAYLREQIKEKGLKTQAEAIREATKPSFLDIGETSELPSFGKVPEGLGNLITREERLQQLKFETSSDIQKLRAGEPVKLYSGLPAEELEARYKVALEKGKRLRETFTGQEFKTGSKGYAPGEKTLSGLVADYYKKHGTAEDLVSLKPKVEVKPKPKVEVSTTDTSWEAEVRRAGAEAYRDQPITIFGKEEPVPMLKPKLAEPKVKVKEVAVAERQKPTIKTLYTKEELGIVEKPKIEVKPTEPKVIVKRDITAELKQKWAERNLSLEKEAKEGRAQVTKQGQVLLLKKPTQVQEVKQIPIIDLTKLEPNVDTIFGTRTQEKAITEAKTVTKTQTVSKAKTVTVPSVFAVPQEVVKTDISTFTGIKTVPEEKTKVEIKSSVATEPATKTTIKVEPAPVVKPTLKTRPNEALRPWLDIFWNDELGEIPLDLPEFDKMGEKRIVRKKRKLLYKYRPRTSPIKETGAEKLFQMPSDVAPKKTHRRIKVARTKKSHPAKIQNPVEDYWSKYNLEENILVPAKREKKPTTESSKEFWEL